MYLDLLTKMRSQLKGLASQVDVLIGVYDAVKADADRGLAMNAPSNSHNFVGGKGSVFCIRLAGQMS